MANVIVIADTEARRKQQTTIRDFDDIIFLYRKTVYALVDILSPEKTTKMLT